MIQLTSFFRLMERPAISTPSPAGCRYALTKRFAGYMSIRFRARKRSGITGRGASVLKSTLLHPSQEDRRYVSYRSSSIRIFGSSMIYQRPHLFFAIFSILWPHHGHFFSSSAARSRLAFFRHRPDRLCSAAFFSELTECSGEHGQKKELLSGVYSRSNERSMWPSFPQSCFFALFSEKASAEAFQ